MRRDCLDVLVVDDQPGVRYLLDILVKEAGHRVHTAENGLEAIEKVRQIRPHLIFMDVRMPLMGGLEALGRIKRIVPEAEVIIMTAYISDETVNQALQKGALCCMAKPFDIEKVKNLLRDFAWQRDREYFLAGSYVI
ncbi:response regulator [Desulfofundulus thermobenzoicus]|uniref:Stage 0 sporulation protein A homolog n=1 Tax=Desulfofundulus thermobenzoicus TaxID=29376 RepID=A0A6N7IR70_9FIRM|nr:response regulator [Desulfofundulus thermobenzoicus]MQL52605.1 response regulator [Desulfofundulus thermobenzoicus]HHW45128.1 response regulator [Desulfotomaculum sp.]